MKNLKHIRLLIILLISGTAFGQEWVCDDFTDITDWPETELSGDEIVLDDIIGTTQGGEYNVTFGATDPSANYFANGFYNGIWGFDTRINFEFSGAPQTARFLVNYYEGAENYMGFSVNGSSDIFLDSIFPLTIGGVVVDIDTSPPDIGTDDYTYIQFTGVLSEISIPLYETGISELCVASLFDEEDCDDFTNISYWPSMAYSGDEIIEGGIIGYTQAGTQTVTFGPELEPAGICNINTWADDIGINTLAVAINFAFDGSEQKARFRLYGGFGEFTGQSFSVNDSPYILLSETFPMVVDGILVEFESLGPGGLGFEEVYLTFTGELDVVSKWSGDGDESGILELCVEPLWEEGDCDDFTDDDLWNIDGFFLIGDVLGFSQGGLYPVTCAASGGTLNNGDDITGIFIGDGTVQFEFSGTNQHARFKIGHDDFLESYGFAVNGEIFHYLDEVFPVITGGVTVDFDTAPADDPDFGDISYLTFTGDLSTIDITAIESHILELCVEPLFDGEGCDDFTDLESYPEDSFPIDVDMIGDIVGTTQGGTQPITIAGTGPGFSWLDINTEEDYGFYGGCELDFAFDGSEQSARFLVYGWIGDGTEIGFSVNGSTFIPYDETFPMVVDGISIDMDLTPPDDMGSFESFYLTLSGNLDVVTHTIFESGLQELCVGPPADVEVPCDDFTAEPWPMDEIFEPGEIIGYTFDATYPVTVGATGEVFANTDPTYFPGLFINNAPLKFEFDGSDQTVQFEIYEWFGAGSEGFELNGEALTLFDDTYPMTIDGVDIDIDFTGLSVGTAELAHVTFSGELDEIIMIGGELGITGICYESDSTILVGAGINETKKNLISVYPNPADEFISIRSEEPITEIRIYTIAGVLIYTEPNINQNQITLDIEELEQGLYLVEMFLSDGTRVIEKVILE